MLISPEPLFLYTLRVKHNQKGLIHFLALLLVVFFIWLFFNLQPSSEPATTTEPETTPVTDTNIDISDDNKIITSLRPLVGAIPGSGKAIKEKINGRTLISISAALPNPFESTYYEAWLEGPDTIPLGRMKKVAGSYKAEYDSLKDLSKYKTIRISVDGPATTIEGMAPPFDVMSGSF